MLAWANGYAIPDSSLVGRSNIYRGVQDFTIFQAVSSTKIAIQIHEDGKVCLWAGIFIMVWLLKEGSSEDSEFVLKRGVWSKRVEQLRGYEFLSIFPLKLVSKSCETVTIPRVSRVAKSAG
jgi:hypothetical protein